MLGCRHNSMCGGVLITAIPPPYCGAHILFSCSTAAYMGTGAILIRSNAGMFANEYKWSVWIELYRCPTPPFPFFTPSMTSATLQPPEEP